MPDRLLRTLRCRNFHRPGVLGRLATAVGNAGANIGGPEYNTSTHDPAYRFEAPGDGTYRVRIRDLYNDSVASPAFVYRLSIRRATWGRAR